MHHRRPHLSAREFECGGMGVGSQRHDVGKRKADGIQRSLDDRLQAQNHHASRRPQPADASGLTDPSFDTSFHFVKFVK
jgi:hypothetical protein